MMDCLFKDPLRGISFLNCDQFPYQKGEDEIEIDFMVKSAGYLMLLGVSGLAFMEGGFIVYLIWLSISVLRRNQ